MQNIGVTVQGVPYNQYRYTYANMPVSAASGSNNNNPGGVYRQIAPTYLVNPQQGQQVRVQLDDAENVKLKELPFYDVKEVLYKPTTLVANMMTQDARNRNRARFEARYGFGLTVGQAALIANSIIRDPITNRLDFGYQIQLRFAQLNTTAEQIDDFPPSLICRVNGKQVQLPPLIPSNYPGVPPRQPSTYLNITDHVKLRPHNLMGPSNNKFLNTIYVSWNPDGPMNRNWIFCLRLVHKLRSEDLLQKMVKKGSFKPEVTHQLIDSIMKADEEEGMALSSLKVSVACPLGKNRMKFPCRASTCSHIQCFDAQLYLQMNEKRPAWKCPVCHKEILYGNLVLDGYFIAVLKDLPPNASNDIEISPDRSWRAVEAKAEEIKPAVTTTQAGAVYVDIDDDDDAGSSKGKRLAQTSKAPQQQQQQAVVKSAIPEIICIDSDDEMDTSSSSTNQQPQQQTKSTTGPQTSASSSIHVSFPTSKSTHPFPTPVPAPVPIPSQSAGSSRGIPSSTSLHSSHPLMLNALSAPSSSSRLVQDDDDDIICLD